MKNKNDFMFDLQNIDYSLIAGLISPVVCVYGTSKVFDSYYLYKDFKVKNLDKVYLPRQVIVDNNRIRITENITDDIKTKILAFADVLSKNFAFSDLGNFYNNLKDLIVENKDFSVSNKIFHKTTIANYNMLKNTISIGESHAFYHELFHLASTNNSDPLHCCSGFYQVSRDFSIGRGINEGYTQLLAERFFPRNDMSCVSYPYETQVMEQLECLIRPENMSAFYF